MSLNKNKTLIYFTLFLSCVGFSQEVKTDSTKTEQLEDVIVTATRTVRQLSSLPLPAQIISKKEIQSVNSLRLSDILNEQTGLITVPDFGGGEGIQLQGLDSQYTLILIDGVPLIGRSAGTLDISRVTVGNIKQIEIVKGASSSLYGSEALGGVINIITEKPKYGFNGDLNSRVGSFNTYDNSLNLGYRKKKFSISTFVNSFNSDGYDLNESDALNTVEPFNNQIFNTKLNYNFNDATSLLLSGRYYTQNQDYVASEDLKGESDINEWNTHLKLKHKYSEKWSSYFEFYATRYKADEYLNNPDNSRFSESDFNQLLLRPEIRATYSPNKKSAFIGGLGWNHETLKRTDFSKEPEFNSPYAYLQYDTHPTEKINIILGARFDNHSEYKSQFSPKVALRYKLSDKIAVKGSVGYGYKAPDFRQLYFDFTNATVGYTVLGYNAVSTAIPQLEEEGQIANIVVPISEFDNELKPENSVSFNVGIDYNPITSIKLNFNAFRNNINDLIDTRVIANKTNGQNVFSYYNVHKVYTQGLELNTSWKPSNNLKISGGYQLLFAKEKEAEDAFKNGNVYARLTPSSSSFQLKKQDYFGLYNRSRHMGNLKVFYEFTKLDLDANIRGTYRSKYGLYDTNGNTYLDTYDDFVKRYTIWDLAINKTLFKNYTLGFGIDNVLNFRDTQNISNISGRIIYGKLNIQF
ncbi:outer membrane receptor for ferrienterochelin and colicins [Flaviramulus basaltis]|uniref:Outer membrane receptor for ferrienterochelin and colicins n=1 Tax=Flaviramulus basaltis TaxID=369401 RepID=A0A1K2IDF1_9FLAO|nr:TonB-dependent receptor [Flaviramulus basaltis]SFZ90460.1 outer membrane receptor for ferrienterochelin and colicins [Flaviramulus basaltis]